MAEQMTEVQLLTQERTNAGTSWTNNKQFDKDGYLVIKDLWDPEELYHPVPKQRGQYNYWDKDPDHFHHMPVEQQVEGSLSLISDELHYEFFYIVDANNVPVNLLPDPPQEHD